ncbi:MAG: exodeoxyribonuclease VII large subunit [Eubacteriales bacterium]|nr:exodeoxyribonuclease VII large subunit [Eubacteriales bacterium]
MSRVYSVGQVNTYIRSVFDREPALKRISVQGEISNCTYHRSGHIYFTLKDEKSQIACVMFSGDRLRGLGFHMKNGDRVVITGSIEVYIRDGKYQLYAKKIELAGAGLLYERYLALKAKLDEEGLFASEHKKQIPKYVKYLGIVTAPTGAAVQDIRNISLRRNPYIQLYLYPALVQGENAAESIVEGIRTLDRLGVDCIIVGRGGGSIEDLWAFNEEIVARAIYDCETPIISAVGHETDFTIADFAADLRAPTPSAAAELAVSDVTEILQKMENYRRRLTVGMRKNIDASRAQLQLRSEKMKYLSPGNQMNEKRMHLAELSDRLAAASERVLEEKKRKLTEYDRTLRGDMERNLERTRYRFEILTGRMEGVSPLKKLRQGFSYVENAGGQNITSITQVEPGEVLTVHVTDGIIRSTVQEAETLERTK